MSTQRDDMGDVIIRDRTRADEEGGDVPRRKKQKQVDEVEDKATFWASHGRSEGRFRGQIATISEEVLEDTGAGIVRVDVEIW